MLAASVLLLVGCTGATEPSGATGPSGAAGSVTTTGSAASSPPAAASTAGPTTPGPSASGPSTSGPSASGPSSTAPAVSLRVAQLAPGVSDEASGIAAATTAPGLFFLVDDGTGADDLAVVDEHGSLVTRVALTGMAAANAEALAGGPCGPVPRPDGDANSGPCLYVGDIGDNREQRDDIVLYRSSEPDLAAPDPGPRITVAADEWHYAYPDGPHNAESMLVDADGSLLIITKPKNGAPHRMYRGEPGGGELTLVREFRIPGSERPLRTILTGNVATDLAATPGRVLLLTYDDVHEYTAADPAADLSTFPDWPTRSLPFPQLPQAEGIAGAADGCGYVVASEAGPGGTEGSLGIATCG
ncbi:MAG TPA: hypothetical protein VIC62_19890 [Nakamurella sp.]|jgi:hypothetical protein